MANLISPICAATLCVAAVGSMSAFAQDASSGRSSTFTFGSTLSTDSNPDLEVDGSDAETILQLDLGYELGLRTQTTDIEFGLSANVQAGDNNGLDSPTASLSVTHDAPRHTLSFSALSVRTDVSDISISSEDDDTDLDVFETDGEREYNRLSFGVVGGIDRPLGYDISYTTTDVRYDGTTSSSYSDTDTDVFSLGLTAEITPRIETTLDLSYRDYTSDNSSETHTETSSASLGASLQLDDVTQIEADLGYTKIDSETVSEDSRDEGGTFGLAINREDRLGTYSLAFDHSINTGGKQNTLMFSRTRDFPLGAMELQAGLTKTESGSATVVGGLDFNIERQSQDFDFSASRSVTLDDDGNETTISKLSGAFSQALTEFSNFEVGLVGRLDEEGDEDDLTVSLSAAYVRSLTEDTSLSLGMATDLSRESDGTSSETARSTSAFVSLSREIERRH
jgi:hypothetical protein